MSATVTPLASIFGSGFLIIVPILERTLGALALLGAVAVCAVAWLVGTSIRHCVRVVEPLAAAGRLDPATARLERVADAVIVVAYVISVALYLRIMAQYIVGFAVDGGAPTAERVLACAAVGVIVAVGVLRGFHGLDVLERIALATVLALTVVLGAALAIDGGGALLGDGLRLPPVAHAGLGTTLAVLGGILIAVQGFETVRYLGDEYDGPTRIRASRLAQATATVIYVAFVALATPLMGLGTSAGADTTLLEITDRVAPALALPLVLCATLSQFSAATADTAAADGNLRGLVGWMSGARAYLVSGAAAVALAATTQTFVIITVASRAFAAYYALQALIALRTADGAARRLGYGLLAVVMAAIALLAQPVG